MPAPDPALLFPNPPLDSLLSTLSHLALRRGLALKFPRDVTPFSALLENSPAALTDLHSLDEPSESTYVVSPEPLQAPPPSTAGITIAGPYGVRQFEFPADAPLPPIPHNLTIEPLTCAHAADGRVHLRRLPRLLPHPHLRNGPIRHPQRRGSENDTAGTGNIPGRLVAICGEHITSGSPEGDFHEISGLCTLPEFRGRGYAPALLAYLLHQHHAAGLRSSLHVASDNATAIALYQRLGFLSRGEFPLYSVRRLT